MISLQGTFWNRVRILKHKEFEWRGQGIFNLGGGTVYLHDRGHYSETGWILARGSAGSQDHMLKAQLSETAKVPVVQNGQRVMYDKEI